jgi:hypothetical protein
MKRIKFALLMVVALSLATVMSAFAGTAYQASFTTSITYQNVTNQSAEVVFNFYPQNNGTPITVSRELPAGAGASLFIGSLDSIAPGFGGSAVMSSDKEIVATMVQISSDPAVKNRPLSNGFSSGSPEVLLATVLKNQFNTTSRFSVQNAGSVAANLQISFYNANNPSAAPIVVNHNNLPVGAAQYFDMGALSQITASTFNGSAVIRATTTTNPPQPVDIVASVLELSTTGVDASSFEGVTSGSNTVYMPSALCDFANARTAYAVQNTSSSQSAVVTITYSNGQTDGATVSPGAKRSFNGCTVNPANFNGSATITSVGGEIVVIGKVFGGGNSTAFVGASSGNSKLALPYVRFTKSQWETGQRQRAYIAVQNVGSNLSSSQVVLEYRDRNGKLIGTHTLGAMTTGQKLNSNPSHPGVVLAPGATQAELDEFGYVGGFGGSVIVNGPQGSQLVAVVRIQSYAGGGNVVGEDYNGIPVGDLPNN